MSDKQLISDAIDNGAAVVKTKLATGDIINIIKFTEEELAEFAAAQYKLGYYFYKNVDITKKSNYWEAKCKKGLWSIGAATKDKAIEGAKHYFKQYYDDGEYDE